MQDLGLLLGFLISTQPARKRPPFARRCLCRSTPEGEHSRLSTSRTRPFARPDLQGLLKYQVSVRDNRPIRCRGTHAGGIRQLCAGLVKNRLSPAWGPFALHCKVRTPKRGGRGQCKAGPIDRNGLWCRFRSGCNRFFQKMVAYDRNMGGWSCSSCLFLRGHVC